MLHLAHFDWNCPQHIVPRFTKAEVAAARRPMRSRLDALETENAALRAKLATIEGTLPWKPTVHQ